jgi:hypothetical protein
MNKKPAKDTLHRRKRNQPLVSNPEGYPLYPEGEDIYGNYQKEGSIDPEDPSRIKETADNLKTGKNNELDFSDDVSGKDLDVPGSEPDDESELKGTEDEENNYYSLGGDDQSDLDEDHDEC